MKKSRYTDSQILSILKQNKAGATVPDLCREHSMSTATFYTPQGGTEVNGVLNMAAWMRR